ncbi:MAG: CHAP domain-containing protein [Paenirhodobacter sp.]
MAHVTPASAETERREVVRVASMEPGEVKAAVARTSAVNRSVGRIWCVPFAREVSGINIRGNAKTWWHQAEREYAKGQRPVVGSVLNFRATRKMPLGHVAVVSKVLSPRKILVDHANWRRNQVSLNMAVVDVSPRNDWSAVRVESVPNTLGDVYPTYGFIYRAAANG